MSFSTAQEAIFIAGSTELYDIDFGDHIEYYTIKPRTVTYLGNTYTTLPISRSEVKRDPELGSDEFSLMLPLNPSMVKYLGDGAPGMIGVTIHRGFGDPETQPENYKVWFQGELKQVKWVRNSLDATVASKDYLLFACQLPRVIHSPGCNNELYGPICSLVKANFTGKFAVIGIARAGTQLRLQPADAFATLHFFQGDTDAGNGLVEPGYFTLGKCWEEGYEGGVRHVISHQYTAPQAVCFLELHSPVPDLIVGDVVNVSAGCDKRLTTCGVAPDDPASKFNNFVNNVSFSRVPSKNPVQVGFIPYYSE